MSAFDGNDRPFGAAWDTLERTDDGNPALASAVISLTDWLAGTPDERKRVLDGRVLEDLYGGRWVDGESLAPGVNAYGMTGGDPVKLNFARNAVDFVQTKVCAETPAVVASERGGGYRAERRAQLLTEYIDRLTDSCGLMDLLPEACLSALRTGTSVVKTFTRRRMPMAELVPAEWVHVDPIEGRNGDPRSLYERRPVSRRALMQEWVPDADPESEDPSEEELAIRSAPPSRDPLDLGMSSTVETIADTVDVYEAWSLGDPEHPGRHVVCVHGAVLLDEDWTLPRFPHAFLGIDRPPPGRGFWSQGLLCQLDEAQAEIDFLLAQVSEQIRLGRLKVFVQVGSRVNEDQLAASRQGEIVKYDGTIPHFVTPPTVGREALEHIQWLVGELYQTIGMDERAASSQKPAGVNSGRAILFFHDFQTRRFVDLVKRYGRLTIDVVERLLDRAEGLHVQPPDDDDEGGGDPGSETRGLDDRLDWAKVRMDREDFSLRLETVSAVPRSYAGRTQRIEQLIAQGQLPATYWTEFLSDPNAWRAEHRAAAQAEAIEWLLEVLSDPDEELPRVSDHLDLATAIEVLNGEILTLERKGAGPEVIDRFEDFFDAVVARQAELAAANAPPTPPPQGLSPTAPELGRMGVGGLGPTEPG